MKVINICYDDYANFSFDNCQALRSLGIYAHSYKRVKHPFGYESESAVVANSEIQKHIDDADLIQLMHSDTTWLQYCVDKGKRVVMYHTGTTYRLNSGTINEFVNPRVERCFTDQCEFIGLGMHLETYIATAIDTEKFKPRPWLVKEPYTVAHYPSNPGVKGTGEIIEMMNKITRQCTFNFSTDKVNHLEQLRRMSQCDIYVEMFAPTLHGKPYGVHGVTAFEAAAMGKLVLTNNIREDVYKSAYGESELQIANTEADFIKTMDLLLSFTQHTMRQAQEFSREWIIKNHSYKATGERLVKLLGI